MRCSLIPNDLAAILFAESEYAGNSSNISHAAHNMRPNDT